MIVIWILHGAYSAVNCNGNLSRINAELYPIKGILKIEIDKLTLGAKYSPRTGKQLAVFINPNVFVLGSHHVIHGRLFVLKVGVWLPEVVRLKPTDGDCLVGHAVSQAGISPVLPKVHLDFELLFRKKQ